MKLESFKNHVYTEGLFTGTLATWFQYRFAYLIYRKFKEWEAFKHGLIDAEGNLIREPKTAEEKRIYGPFDNLVRKIKKVIVKYAGDSAILSTLISIYLLKKESREESRTHHEIKLEIADELTNEEIMLLEKLLMEIKTNENL